VKVFAPCRASTYAAAAPGAASPENEKPSAVIATRSGWAKVNGRWRLIVVVLRVVVLVRPVQARAVRPLGNHRPSYEPAIRDLNHDIGGEVAEDKCHGVWPRLQ